MSQFCKTNPISEKPKMNLNHYTTRDYENKLTPSNAEKQTQSNPTCSEQFGPELTAEGLVEPIANQPPNFQNFPQKPLFS